MAGVLKPLFSQNFTSSSSIAITHNLNRAQLSVRVIVNGVATTSLIQDVEVNPADPLNALTVTLSSSATGQVQILENDIVSAPTFGPDQQINVTNSGLVYVSANDTTPDYLGTKLVSGTRVTLTENNDGGNETLTVATTAEANTASNEGTAGVGPFIQKTGENLEFKNINAASARITVTDDVANNKIDIDVFEANINADALNNSNKVRVSSNDTTSDYLGTKLVAGTNITLTENNDGSNETVSIATTAEINTASNEGVGGVGPFIQKTGVNLEFKNINAGSNKISVTDDVANDEIDIDVVEANLTITASQVSDFDTEVSNNTDVSANTTARNQSKVSANDTTDDYLGTKIVAGSNISVTELNDGSNETLEIAYSGAAGGTLLTGNIAWVDAVNGNDGTGTVGQAGLPYLTIKAAHDAISAGQVVIVRPGSYSETPFTLGTNKTIISQDGPERTTFDSTLATGVRLTLSGDAVFRGFTIKLPTDTTHAVEFVGSGEVEMSNIIFEGSGANGSAFTATVAATGGVNMSNVAYKTGTCDRLIRVIAGNHHFKEFHLHSGTVTHAFDVSGGDVLLENIHCTASNVTSFIEASGGLIHGSGNTIRDCTNGIHITSNTASIELSATTIKAGTWDLLIDGGLTTSTIHLIGCEMQEDKFSIPSTWLFDDTILTFQDEKVGDKANKNWGEVNVGAPEKGFETVMGEGDSYTRGMVVFTTDNTATSTTDGGTFTDVSSAAASKTGSTFSFQGTSANHTILVGSSLFLAGGSDKLKHWGLKVTQTTAAIEVTPKSFVFEIWDGSAWVEIGTMATESSNFYRYADEHFIRANSDEHIRYGVSDSTTWVKKTINSQELYWARIRIDTSLTTAPVFEQFKLSTSRFEANADGTNTFHGLSRFRETLVGSGNIFGETGGVTDVNSNVGTGGLPTGWLHTLKNSLLNGNGDALMFQFPLPRGIDTSQPITMKMIYQVGGTTASTDGTLIFSALPVEVEGNLEADPSGGVTPIARTLANTEALQSKQAQTLTTAIFLNGSGGNDDKLQSISFDTIDITDYYEGDMLILRVELDEDGTPNTDVKVWSLEVSGVMWTHGEKL